ncbi:class E sortase [Microbacterium allomyrinae]|uniref:class E sortase n=1 Tax=Microbacterium allomyrinae TaxID=2830666 RepID=UPI001E33F82E|nr:class E sortase [Microbacterium allomyrinae]
MDEAVDTRRPRRRTSVVVVLGELLITAGVIVLLYVAWQLWLGDMIYGAERNATGHELSEEWAEAYEPPVASETAEPTDPAAPVTAPPPVLAEPADAETFALMRIPRFGSDYAVPMAGGTSRARTLDPIGIGHYPGTKMPGEVGNFAVAAHRTTWGKPFNRIAELHVGDAIVIETQEGWYTYRFRTLEYVTPDEVEVLLPVPQAMNVPAGTAYITMTSCSPMFSLAERIVAYGVFESYTPRTAGEPASLEAVT